MPVLVVKDPSSESTLREESLDSCNPPVVAVVCVSWPGRDEEIDDELPSIGGNDGRTDVEWDVAVDDGW